MASYGMTCGYCKTTLLEDKSFPTHDEMYEAAHKEGWCYTIGFDANAHCTCPNCGEHDKAKGRDIPLYFPPKSTNEKPKA